MRDEMINDLEAVLAIYHRVAAGLDGVIVLTGIDPKTGKAIPQRFGIGDVTGMVARAQAWSEAHLNVYFAPVVYSKNLPAGRRGKEGDAIAVLGLVLDDDADTGKRVTLPPGIAPTIEITTSTKPSVNRHLHLVFTQPKLPDEAKALAERLHRICGGDNCGKDVMHVWRLPGTLNYPTVAKIKRGRPAEPQWVTLGTVGKPFDPVVLPPEPGGQNAGDGPPEVGATASRADHTEHARSAHGDTGDDAERQAILAWVSLWLRKKIKQETNGADRSTHAHSVFLGLMEHGLNDREVRLVADGAPFARKFWERGDLDAEIARERTKWQQAGGDTTGGAPKGKARAKPQQGWRASAPFLLTAKGAIKPLLENVMVALSYAPQWKGVLGYDEFGMVVMVIRPPPWLKAGEGHNSWEPRRWSDNDDRLATAWMQRQGIFIGKVSTTVEAVQAVAREAPFHPVRQYLDRLVWDGVARCRHLASRYFGADDSDYHQTVSKCSLIAAVARIMEPGCQADNMPWFEGGQGIGKSKCVRAMFTPWFSDDLSDLGTKDAKMEMQGVWGLEVAELAAMGRPDVEKVKAFVSRRTDRFRPSYGRHVIEAPRQAVMWATTNQDSGTLKDETGGRRFWPVRCGKHIDVDGLTRDRDQIWAEAVHLYKQGEPWWMTDPKIEKAAREAQESRRETDPWETDIAEHLAEVVRDAPKGEVPCTSISVIFGKLFGWDEKVGKRTPMEEKRVLRCLKASKWRYSHRGPRPARVKMYAPDPNPDDDDGEGG